MSKRLIVNADDYGKTAGVIRGIIRAHREGIVTSTTVMMNMAQVEATYLAWIDVRKLKLPNPHKWFEKAGVGLSDGGNFDGDGYLRMNFGCSRHLLNKALDRMARVLTNGEK